MRILFLCRPYPYPESFGSSLRIRGITKILAQRHHVSLVVLADRPPSRDEIDDCRQHFGEFRWYVARPARRDWRAKLERMAMPRRIEARTDVISRNDRAELLDLRAVHDATWIHTLSVADRSGIYAWPGTVLDIDDLNSVKMRRSARVAPTVLDRVRGLWRAALWHRWERDWPRRFPVACVCSEADRALIAPGLRVHVVPNGFDVPEVPPERLRADHARIGMIGVLRYHPNVEGLIWFCEQVLPELVAAAPEMRLRVVGRSPDGGPPLSHPNLDFLGYLGDPCLEMSTWSASIVPIRIGGGTRIKILDAFSNMCPVISTRLGAYGLDVTHGKELLLADEPHAFAAACLMLVREPARGRSLADAGFRRAQVFSWPRIAPRIYAAIEDAASTKHGLR